MSYISPLTFGALLLTAHSSSAGAWTASDDGTARIGQTIRVDGPSVRPDRIIEDSRCPVGVACIRKGDLVLRATVSGGRWKKVIDLTLGTPLPIADGMLTLIAATPARRTHGPAPSRGAWRFTFRFDGGL